MSYLRVNVEPAAPMPTPRECASPATPRAPCPSRLELRATSLQPPAPAASSKPAAADASHPQPALLTEQQRRKCVELRVELRLPDEPSHRTSSHWYWPIDLGFSAFCYEPRASRDLQTAIYK